MMPNIKITECPRDAMQGINRFIPTDLKAAYINLLLQVGFDTIDFGSFVSAHAVPQMQDTAEVLKKLDLSNSKSKLLAIVANYRGASEASQHQAINYLGYPFSVSETFQCRNANTSMAEAFDTVKNIFGLCTDTGKKLRIYLSMGFGNPYGDEWSIDILKKWALEFVNLGIGDIYVADTIGIATPGQITSVMNELSTLVDVPFGIHLHSTPESWEQKIAAAYQAGCRLFDTALKGYGGCPMAKDELTGNIATENLIAYLRGQNEPLAPDDNKLNEALNFSSSVFL